ncbi:erythrocyte-binding protein [Cystoisospora suis]|uniref:Erythrocyte-binding protein n=1 Tax=Cystoisospora suis TaxID=483139 RepID=A0A2C6KXL6_9APIC|nr:erythrocyte-binding protein [Cystoisospora suis]
MTTVGFGSTHHETGGHDTDGRQERSHLEACAAHFDHLFDSIFCLISFDSLVPTTQGHCEEDNVPRISNAKTRGREKWQLRQKRYSPHVLLRTCLRLRRHAQAEGKKIQRDTESGSQVKRPKNRVHTSHADPTVGTLGHLPCRAELCRRLEAKIEQLKQARNNAEKVPGASKNRSVAKGEECSSQQERADSAQKKPTKERQLPVRVRPRQSTDRETVPADFDFGVVTRPGQSCRGLEAGRAGTKRRRLQKAMKEIRAKREELDRCRTAGERRETELKHSLDKARRKLSGEKVMDDMSRVKKKEKICAKKKRARHA